MKELKYWKVGRFWMGALLLGALATLTLRAQNYPTQILSQSPLDYWRFSETNSSPPLNTVSNLGSTGDAGNGYVLDGAIRGEPGIVGNCIMLTNKGQDVGYCYSRVDIPNLPALNPNPPFTVEFWMKPNAPFNPSDSTGLCPVSSDSPNPDDTSRSGYLFYVSVNDITFNVGGEGGYSASAVANVTPSTTNWTHVVGEFDGTTASIYINGNLEGSGSAEGSPPFFANQWVPTRVGGNSLDGDEYIFLGEYIFYLTGSRGWDGGVDELAVYNTLLSPNTIKQHYITATTNPNAYDALVLASSPVGYWNFDEPAYNSSDTNYPVAMDSGSLGDNGTNTYGALADQPGVPGLSVGDKSVFYSGEAGYLDLSSNLMEQNVGGEQITLAAWVKSTTLGVSYAGDIIAQGFDLSDSEEENYLRIADTFDWEGNGNADVTYYDVGTYNGGAQYNSAIYPVPPGDIGHWVFLVGTYDGTEWNLYRNGVLLAQYQDGGSGPASLTDQWSVGSRSEPNPYFGFFFPGWIAEPAIITNALDAATISNLYNSVALPPVITQAPVAPSPAYFGTSATFSVWADGPGTLTYEWSSNGVLLAGQTETNFSLTGLTSAADGTYSVVVSSQYGSVTSSVVLFVTTNLPSVTLVPSSETRWIGSPLSFTPASIPNLQLSYQWNLNGQAISGATQSTYSAPTTTANVGSYTLVMTSSFSASTSSVATLTALPIPTNTLYTATILADQPLSYFRLDETSGTNAYDYAGGNNGVYYGNVELGQPGYVPVDPDFAVYFPGEVNSYVGDIGPTNIDFYGTEASFSIEAWANGGQYQINNAAVIAKGEGTNGTQFATEQFAIVITNTPSGQRYQFLVRDRRGNGPSPALVAPIGPDGTWHYLVGVCSGRNLILFIDGQPVAAGTAPSDGILESQDAVSIGAEKSGTLTPYDWAYRGTIDEVAIYNYALSPQQIYNHYAAAYGPDLAPVITIQPVSVTNYYNLPATLSVQAYGTVPLNYQWNMAGAGPIPGATASSYVIPNLAYSDAGTYTVGITNTLTGNVVTGLVSVPVTITVLAPPTNPPPIAGLVLHLPFDNNLFDATGRGNNATNEASGGAPLITNDYVPGVIGDAFLYQTSVTTGAGGNTNANYASIGVRPDLQFSSNISFTVSFWIQEPLYYTGNDLPFLCDVIGSTTGYPGYCFEPSYGTKVGTTAGSPGSWGFSVYDNTDTGEDVYGDVNTPGVINDGNFHNLIYVIDRVNGATVYLDGVVAHQNPQAGSTVAGLGDIDSTNGATIGQDPTGLYGQASADSYFAIDDLGIWRRPLTPLEAAAIYSAGINNGVSFAGAPLSFTFTNMAKTNLVLNWNEGELQGATNLSGPWTTVAVTPPYTNTPSGPSMFFRVKF